MAVRATGAYHFGDLLALARLSWVRQMGAQLARHGFPDYRPGDAGVLRVLARRPAAIGEIGTYLGVTRQAARKMVAGLERRGFATTAPDPHDARRVIVTLTPQGEAYTAAVVSAIAALDERLQHRVGEQDLTSADAVLRAVFPDEGSRAHVDRLVPPLGTR